MPADVPLWAAMRRSIDLIVPPLEGNRAASDRLAAIIAATPSLHERAVAKEARLVALITELLVERGASADEAGLVARVAWGVLSQAVADWRAEPSSRLQTHVDRSFALLSGLIGA
jgi:hypothetical protein